MKKKQKDLVDYIVKFYKNKTRFMKQIEMMIEDGKKEPIYLPTPLKASTDAYRKLQQMIICIGCDALCCKHDAVKMLTHEYKQLKAGAEYHKWKKYWEPNIRETDKGYEMGPPCPILDKEGWCSLYASRPGVCRLYPLTSRHLGKNLTLWIHTLCPRFENIVRDSWSGYHDRNL